MLGQDLKQRGMAESKQGRGANSNQRVLAGQDLWNAASMMPPLSKLDVSSKLVSGYQQNGLLRGDETMADLSVEDYYKKLHKKMLAPPS